MRKERMEKNKTRKKRSLQSFVKWLYSFHSMLPAEKTDIKKEKKLAGTKESTCSHLKQNNQMKHIIRFEYHEKIIFNIIAKKITTKAEKIILKTNHILRATAHSKKYPKGKEEKTFFSPSFLVSLVEIYNQANARNKSRVMYKSHLNAPASTRRFSYFFLPFRASSIKDCWRDF